MAFRHIFQRTSYVERVGAPDFTTDGWNEGNTERPSGYAFSMNIPEMGGAQPGTLRARWRGLVNSMHPLVQKLEEDGHRLVGRVAGMHASFDPRTQYVLAAFSIDDESGRSRSEILRLGSNGLYSYMPKDRIPREVDFNDRPILDPLHARLSPDTRNTDNMRHFVGYFLVAPRVGYAARMDRPGDVAGALPISTHEHP